MFIEELELKGYNRLKLNQFTKIHLKFTEKIQLILGTNGSGKSSILAEMSPLPAESKNFSPQGFKKIVIRKDKKRYTLTSSFGPAVHSFKIEGEDDDLNPGGTITEQKVLVKRIFGIDALTHGLATGNNEFHSMSTNVRRDHFRILSETNYDYAIGVYNRLREASRDSSGALKLARNKLVAQTSRMMSKDDLAALQLDCEELYKIVELFIENRNSPSASLEETQHLVNCGLEDIEAYSLSSMKALKRVEAIMKLGLVENPKDAPSLEFFISNRIQEIKQKKSALFQENKKCQDIVDIYDKTKLFQVASISTELETLKKQKSDLEKSLIYRFETYQPKRVLKNLEDVFNLVAQMAIEIPVNEKSTKFTRERFNGYAENKTKLLTDIGNLRFSIGTHSERLDHHDDHKHSPTVACPKCTHEWQPFYNKDLITEIKSKIKKCVDELEFKGKCIVDLDAQIEDFNHWMKHIEAMKDLAQKNPALKDFWSLVMKKEVLFENPRQIALFLQNYKDELIKEITLEAVNEKIDGELAKLEMVQSTHGLDHQQAVVTIGRIGDELFALSQEELRFNSMKDVVTELACLVKKIELIEPSLKEKEKELDKNTQTFLEDKRRIMFNDLLRSFQSELAAKEKIINDEKMYENSLKALETEISDLEMSVHAYKLVLKELSPTEGIIAEGLFGYIKLFVKRMNRFISGVWSYPLVVLPCTTEEGKLELNYKFPLMVGSADNVRNDILQGSSSMHEIIDLGFTVCALKTMGLGQGQLFLDEFGSNMDSVHKQQTTKMISDIVENEKFSQIFLISHDITQYGSLENSEICVLNAANVIIPRGCTYNTHVTFE